MRDCDSQLWRLDYGTQLIPTQLSDQYIEIGESRSFNYEFPYSTNMYIKVCADYTIRPVGDNQEVSDDSLDWVSSFVESTNTGSFPKPMNYHTTNWVDTKAWYDLTV